MFPLSRVHFGYGFLSHSQLFPSLFVFRGKRSELYFVSTRYGQAMECARNKVVKNCGGWVAGGAWLTQVFRRQ